MLNQSEAARLLDQQALKRAQQQIAQQCADNKTYQEKLSAEISSLKATIQSKDVQAFEKHKEHIAAINHLNKLHAERQCQYVHMIDDLKKTHSGELAEVRKQHREDCASRDTKHTTEIDRLKNDFNARVAQLQAQLDVKDKEIADSKTDHTSKQLAAQRHFEEWQKTINAKNFAQVMKLQTELSLLVKVKAMEQTELRQMIEDQRSKYELRINDQDQQIKKLSQQVLTLNATILELQTSLIRYRDIEDQLRMSREHEEQMRLAKIELQNELTTASAYIL